MWKNFTVYIHDGGFVVELQDGKVVVDRHNSDEVCPYIFWKFYEVLGFVTEMTNFYLPMILMISDYPLYIHLDCSHDQGML